MTCVQNLSIVTAPLIDQDPIFVLLDIIHSYSVVGGASSYAGAGGVETNGEDNIGSSVFKCLKASFKRAIWFGNSGVVHDFGVWMM